MLNHTEKYGSFTQTSIESKTTLSAQILHPIIAIKIGHYKKPPVNHNNNAKLQEWNNYNNAKYKHLFLYNNETASFENLFFFILNVFCK